MTTIFGLLEKGKSTKYPKIGKRLWNFIKLKKRDIVEPNSSLSYKVGL